MTTGADVELALRAGEIAAAALAPLGRLILEEITGGKKEQEALRTALARLASRADLEPVLPRVRTMIAARRERDAEDTQEVPAPPERSR